MENLLDLYHRPYDPKRPLLAMDEHPVQLTGETRIPVPEKPGHPRRYDYEYERNGTAANFLFLEPLTGRRKVHVRERRTAVDWAKCRRNRLDWTSKSIALSLTCIG